MPHIVVKMYAGRSDAEKQKLAEAITHAAMNVTGNTNESFSVKIEDVDPKDWAEKVYRQEILPDMENLVKKPGYTM